MKQYKHIVFFLILGFLGSGKALCGQQIPDVNKAQLANKYYQSHDFTKASVLYNELFQSNGSSYYFEIYLTCLTESGNYDLAEREIKRALRKNNSEATLYVQWAMLLKKQHKEAEAEKKLMQALNVVSPSRIDYTRLGNMLLSKGEYASAEQLYLQAPQKLPGEVFLNDLGRVYLYQRNYQRMFEVYLDLIRKEENGLSGMESAVQSALHMDVDNSLQQQFHNSVLKRIQQEPSVMAYNRLLIWLFLQEKNYSQALRQQIALDKRAGGESHMIMELARIASRNGIFDDALEAYDYLISNGESGAYFYQAKLMRIDLLYRQFIANPEQALNMQELTVLFETGFKELGFVAETKVLILDYAHLLAFGLNQPEKAIELLKQAMKISRLQAFDLDEMKTELADIDVLTGDVWEAVLLYSQVIEANKTNDLGDQVKMKKARLGYYMGEFAWAKAQLDVLKASTSKLIANDAMELSLFIGNNMNLDTTSVPLELFARADLLQFRNQTDSAWAMLDRLQVGYPYHSLQDDIYYRKASVMEKKGKWMEAASFLEHILAGYPNDLLADDALMELGNLYRAKLNDPSRAKGYYLKLMEQHPGSVHVSQARTYYRQLRGDFHEGVLLNTPPNETVR